MQNLKRQREAMVMQRGEDLVSMLEKMQRTCFARVYIQRNHVLRKRERSYYRARLDNPCNTDRCPAITLIAT